MEIDFSKGLTVFTGETGVGKSILLDALSFGVGFKNKNNILKSEDKDGEIITEFIIKKNKKLKDLLTDSGFTFEENLLLRRVIQKKNKRIKTFINDKNCSQDFLKKVSNKLLDIQNQNDSQGLFDSNNHRKILDIYGGFDGQLNKTKLAWLEYQDNIKKYDYFKSELHKFNEYDNITNKIKEMENLNIVKNEIALLHEKRKNIDFYKANRQKVYDSLGLIKSDLIDKNIISCIKKIQGLDNNLQNFENIINMLDNALININEVRISLEENLDAFNYDSHILEEIETRIGILSSLSRKYNINEHFLYEELERYKSKLSEFLDLEKKSFMSKEKLEKSKQIFLNEAEKLTKKRFQAAKGLDNDISKELKSLNLEKAAFKTNLKEIEGTRYGKDKVLFQIRTNPGVSFGDLGKIASGGELSRFLLAIKVCISKQNSSLTIIFDEIDRGVGGATAEAVGERLSKLAKDSQVLAVTHSPQVAGHALTHIKLEKKLDNVGNNETNVRILADEERIEEIARMLSGYKITHEAKEVAKLMLKKY